MTRAGLILREVKPQGFAYTSKEWKPMADKIKKLPRELCKRTAASLMGKPYAPKEEEAITVVIDALREYCLSEGHLKRTVQRLIDDVPSWPDVTDIRRVALEMREVESAPNPNCNDCYGSGYRTIRKTVKVAGFGEQTLEGSDRCDCWRWVRKVS